MPRPGPVRQVIHVRMRLDEIERLDEFVDQYRRVPGFNSINRSDIIRTMIESVDSNLFGQIMAGKIRAKSV